MHGTDDTITSPEASQKFAQNTSKNLCELKLWDGLYHSLHNEINNHELYSYVNNWILSRVAEGLAQ
jgi:alpha-beta hydrolase superfamily lysophospholipase